jgi:hypothetical protein
MIVSDGQPQEQENMKMLWSRFIAVTIAVAGLAFSGPALAAPVAGDHEAEVAAGFFHAQGSDSGAFNADINLGHYLTPGWEIGFRQALSYNFIDDGRDTWVATTAPFLNYNFHFLDGRLVPFLGGSIGVAYNDRDITGTLGPNAGVKVFLTDQTYLGLRYRYEWFFDSLKRAGGNADHGNHVVNIGIGFVWGGSGRRTN